MRLFNYYFSAFPQLHPLFERHNIERLCGTIFLSLVRAANTVLRYLVIVASPASIFSGEFVWRFAGNGYQDPKTAMLQDTLEKPERWGDPHSNGHQRDSSWDANISPPGGNDKATADMASVHRHFHSLERQQLSMMEMLQVNF